MPSILDSCPKAGATVVRSSWPRRVVGFVAVSGRIVAYDASAARWRAQLWFYAVAAVASRPRALQSLALPQSWPVVRYSLGAARAACGPWRADARGPRRAARGGVPAALGAWSGPQRCNRVGAACAAAAPTRRARRRIACGPGKRCMRGSAGCSGFGPILCVIDFFLLVPLPIGMHRSYSWCRP